MDLTESPMELLYRAFNSPVGIIVETDDIERFRQRLYAEMRKDPDLKCLSICVSPTDPTSQLWIVKRSPDAPQPGPGEGDSEPPEG
jgi:hypothetical protein